MPQEPSAGHFCDGGDVIGIPVTGGLPDGEVPIVRFSRQPVFEHHQRTHHVGALHVADVDTFDPQRRLHQTECLLNVLQRSRSRREIPGPLELVLMQRLQGVAVHCLSQCAFVAALGHPQRDPGAAQSGQPRGQFVGVCR